MQRTYLYMIIYAFTINLIEPPDTETDLTFYYFLNYELFFEHLY